MFLSSYSGMWFKRMILGLWVLAEGIIYDMFDESCQFDAADFTATKRSACRRYIAIDYGTKNPMAFLDIFDNGTTVYVLREYYWDSRKEQRQKTDAEYGEDLVAFIGEELPDFLVIDPSAASFKLVCRAKGFRVKDADNDVNDGIRVTAMLLSQGRLKVCRDCQNLIEEFQSYVWDEQAARNGQEKPVKQFDHGLDALRYYCHTIIPKWRLRE